MDVAVHKIAPLRRRQRRIEPFPHLNGKCSSPQQQVFQIGVVELPRINLQNVGIAGFVMIKMIPFVICQLLKPDHNVFHIGIVAVKLLMFQQVAEPDFLPLQQQLPFFPIPTQAFVSALVMFGNIGVCRPNVALFRLACKFGFPVQAVNPVNFVQHFGNLHLLCRQQIAVFFLIEKQVAHQPGRMRFPIKIRTIRHIAVRFVIIALRRQIGTVRQLFVQIHIKFRPFGYSHPLRRFAPFENAFQQFLPHFRLIFKQFRRCRFVHVQKLPQRLKIFLDARIVFPYLFQKFQILRFLKRRADNLHLFLGIKPVDCREIVIGSSLPEPRGTPAFRQFFRFAPLLGQIVVIRNNLSCALAQIVLDFLA